MYLTYYVRLVGVERSEDMIKVLCISRSSELSSDDFFSKKYLYCVVKRNGHIPPQTPPLATICETPRVVDIVTRPRAE